MSTAFHTPVDYFGKADAVIGLKSSAENKTAQTKEAPGASGDIAAREVFGIRSTPSVDYAVLTAGNLIGILGSVNTKDSVVYCATGMNVVLSAGKAPAVKFTGESLQTGATVSRTITLPTIALDLLYKAADPLAALTLTGAGCALNEVTIDASCTLARETVSGETVSHNVSGGKVVCKFTINQTVAATKPSIAAATGWDITGPLTCSNPDDDFPVWTCELTKSVAGADPA